MIRESLDASCDGNSTVGLSKRRLHNFLAKAKAAYEFLNFDEENPVHLVWHNPQPIEMGIVWTAILISAIIITSVFWLMNPIPYITPFGNTIVGVGIGLTTALETCHVIWDRPRN